MEKLNSRVVFLDTASSVRGNGERATFQIRNGEDFSVNQTQVMSVCLTSFSMFRNFYNINETNCVFFVTKGGVETKVVIDKGEYNSFADVATAIENGLVGAGFVGATVAFDAKLRKYLIDMTAVAGWNPTNDFFTCYARKDTPPAGYSQIDWFSDSWMILGARPSKSKYGLSVSAKAFDYDSATSTYYSPYVPQLSSLDEIVIRTDLPSMNYQSSGFDATAENSEALQKTDILARIPINRSTYDKDIGMIHYIDSNKTFQLTIGNAQLTQFSLYLTDGRGRFIQEVAQDQALYGSLSFRATLQFDYFQLPTPVNNLPLTNEMLKSKFINQFRG